MPLTQPIEVGDESKLLGMMFVTYYGDVHYWHRGGGISELRGFKGELQWLQGMGEPKKYWLIPKQPPLEGPLYLMEIFQEMKSMGAYNWRSMAQKVGLDDLSIQIIDSEVNPNAARTTE